MTINYAFAWLLIINWAWNVVELRSPGTNQRFAPLSTVLGLASGLCVIAWSFATVFGVLP